MEKLIEEIRNEFHIPPYFNDSGIKNYISEGMARLDFLNPGCNPDKDKTCRSLLKNYVYYAYEHKVDVWEENYATLILSWRLGGVAK